MHSFDITILIRGQGTFHVNVEAYTHSDALHLVKAQYPGCTVMNIQRTR